MEILITESKLERVAINWLNNNYGDLEPYETKEYPNLILYLEGKTVIIEYNKKNKDVYVNYEKIWKFFKSYFSLENEQIQHLIKMWVEENYKLKVKSASYNNVYLP